MGNYRPLKLIARKISRLTMSNIIAAPLVFVAIFTLLCQGQVQKKRRNTDPDDPRNLFANMYGGVYKRGYDDDPRNLFADMYGSVYKRGSKDDPRNLFADMYGGVYKRGSEDDPRKLFADMYGGNFKRSQPQNSGAISLPELIDYLQLHQAEKKGTHEDPRNLFKSIYGGMYKRKNEQSVA